MTFIINYYKPLLKSHNNIYNKNIILNTNFNNNDELNTIYNPIIGSSIGIPLNIIQYIFTNIYYDYNIINIELILLQFAIGITTYGTDRLLDAIDYNNTIVLNNNNEIIPLEKKNYYNYLLKNVNYNIITILSSYLYILYLLSQESETYIFILLLSSTIFYRNLKKEFGQFKAIYIGIFWTIGTIILPIVYHDQNYDIINYPLIYLPNILSLFGSSNLLDIKDIKKDKEDNIYTLPVLYGENISTCISHIAIFLSILLFSQNNNFDSNLWLTSLYELQNFGSFFINSNKTLT
tara:strand:- start:64 stop:939 length:876 start_codon:yes stop_codon:yes gene_type:complete